MNFSFNFETSEDDCLIEKVASNGVPLWFQQVETVAQTKRSFSIVEVPHPINHETFATALFKIDGITYRRLRDIGEHDIDADSDLIPGVYGGGLKIWECTIDLMRYLVENIGSFPDKSCHVLELGCGHGFPGIAALMLGYQNVAFLDLNLEVIRDATWPNIIINTAGNINIQEVRCFAGDWLSFGSFSSDSNTLYDFILTSETIYSLETCQQVVYFLSKYLSLHGLALVATKKFYFGVGGGSYEFENLCRSLGNITAEVVRTFQDGQSNIRDIIVVKRTPNNIYNTVCMLI